MRMFTSVRESRGYLTGIVCDFAWSLACSDEIHEIYKSTDAQGRPIYSDRHAVALGETCDRPVDS